MNFLGATGVECQLAYIHHNIEISFQKFAWQFIKFVRVGSRIRGFYIKKGGFMKVE